MVKKGVDLLLLIIAFMVVGTFILTSVQPYLPYVGLAIIALVIIFVIILSVRLYYSRRKPW